jgi:hypothetical protein
LFFAFAGKSRLEDSEKTVVKSEISYFIHNFYRKNFVEGLSKPLEQKYPNYEWIKQIYYDYVFADYSGINILCSGAKKSTCG